MSEIDRSDVPEELDILRLVWDHSMDGISVYEEFPDKNERCLIDCNQRYAGNSGRSKEALLKMKDTLQIQKSLDSGRKSFIQDVLNKDVFTGHFSWIRPDEKFNIIEYIAVPVKKDGRIFVVGIDRDITEKEQTVQELKSNLIEKEILLREVHHRVKNNLQIIISLLSLQAGKVKDPTAQDAFVECKNRIFTMALVHESLYQYDDFSMIQFKEYADTLMKRLLQSQPLKSRVSMKLDMPDIQLPLTKAIPCALILNELMTNSLKHAFPGGRTGEIKIGLKEKKNNMIEISFNDDGIGIPDSVNFETTDSLGLNLVRMLIKQVKGHIELSRTHGTHFTIDLSATDISGGPSA